jgi:hypothetical protein
MSVPAKLGMGAALVAVGLAGLVYTMPIISDDLSSKKPVYREADVPAYSSSLVPYTAVEIASAAVMTGGIVLCAMGYTERFADSTFSPHTDTSKTDGSNKEKTKAASGA